MKMTRTGRSNVAKVAKPDPPIWVNNCFWIWADVDARLRRRKRRRKGANKQATPADTAYAKSFTGAMWPLVLEKAWVKHCGGDSYIDICAGRFGHCNPGYVAEVLTQKYVSTLMRAISESGEYDEHSEIVEAARQAGRMKWPITMGSIDSTPENEALFTRFTEERNIKLSTNHTYEIEVRAVPAVQYICRAVSAAL
jgi:hypothetical protein